MRAKLFMALSAAVMVSAISLTFAQLQPGSPWPMFRCNLEHTGLSWSYSGPSIPALAWSYRAASTVSSSPALGSDGRLYVGSGNGDNNIYSLNSAGVLAWSYLTASTVSSSPALGSDGRLYVGSSDNNIYSLNSAGVLAWSYSAAHGVGNSPAIGSDGRLYVGSGDNNIYCLNSAGVLAWSYSAASSVESPALGSDRRLYVGSSDNNIYCFEQAPTATPTPTPTITLTNTPTETPTATSVPPTATPIPPLVIDPGPLTAGQPFTVGIALIQNITRPFDYYLFAESPAGIYTIYFNGSVKKGLKPLYRNVRKFNAPYFKTVSSKVRIPASMKGKTITFYSVVVQAGKKLPVRKLSDLTPSTQYVILLAKGAAVVN